MCSARWLALVVAAAVSGATVRVLPGASIPDALVTVRGSTGPRALLLSAGVHRLASPLTLTAADSGITIRGETGTVLDGGVVLPPFVPRADGIVWETTLPDELIVSKGGLSTLYVNGERRLRARAPNAIGGPPWSFPALFSDAATLHMAGPLEPCSKPAFGNCPGVDTTGFFADLSAPGWPQNASHGALDGALVAVASGWLWNWARVDSVNGTDGRVTFVTPTRDAVGAYGTTRDTPSGGRFVFEDALALLDAPGEFFVDIAARLVLYVPLPGETPATVTAVVPNLTTLSYTAGTASNPAAYVTFENVVFQHFGEAGADARLGYWSYSAALSVGPHVVNFSLHNVTVSRGVGDGIGVNSNVAGVTFDRITVSDVGGKGVGPLGDLVTAEQTVTEFSVSNSTVSHVGYVFTGAAAAVHMVGAGARVVNNDLSDSTYAGVFFQGPGGPSRTAAPALEIAFNRITDFGQGITSDFGGVYISTGSDKVAATNWIAADVHNNWISRGRNYAGGYGANGVYTDHGTSGVHFFSNILEGLGGRGGSLHCGKGIAFTNNIVFNISVDNFTTSGTNNGALSSCNSDDVTDPGFSANVSNNIFYPVHTANAWAPQDTTWAPPTCTIAGDGNMYYAGEGAAMSFPAGTLAQWHKLTGADAHSVETDPLLKDPGNGDFTVMPGSPAWALGWSAIEQSKIGVIPAD